MEQNRIENIVCSIKKKIEKEKFKGNYNDVLVLVSLCASILYTTNLYYVDEQLETYLEETAKRLLAEDVFAVAADASDKDAVIFYDGFGLNSRGLAKIYLSALGQHNRLYYVTYKERENAIPDLLNIVKTSGGAAFFIDKGSRVGQIQQLNDVVKKVKATNFVYYSLPDDVVATTLMYAYDGILTRYQINLTDHAFWLGARSIDKCIEFREYGASISYEYRNIPKGKIVRLPFYPDINKNQSFQGYPFEVKTGQKVVFSGGSLYKTLGDGNKYYQIVDYILSKYTSAVFWYAGSGDDTEINKLIAKYPDRVHLSSERSDLYQVLRHCYFYLSTYPICGGLMYQYAASAGKVPLTLRQGSINDGFLINQSELNVDFDTYDGLTDEIDRIMTDDAYYISRSKKMINSVISSEHFSSELSKILDGDSSGYPIEYQHIETGRFRQIYLETLTKWTLTELFVRRSAVMTIAKHYPLTFAQGVMRKLWKKVCRKLSVFVKRK